MSVTFQRATPLHRGSIKDGGHVRFRFLASVASPALSPSTGAILANATLVLAAPFGDLNRLLRARDLGISDIAAGTALTQAEAREIMLCDVNAAAAGSEGVLTTRNIPRARTTCVMRGTNRAAPILTAGPHVIPAVDASTDASGRIVLNLRCSYARASQVATASTYVGVGQIGYIDILYQHSFFRT